MKQTITTITCNVCKRSLHIDEDNEYPQGWISMPKFEIENSSNKKSITINDTDFCSKECFLRLILNEYNKVCPENTPYPIPQQQPISQQPQKQPVPQQPQKQPVPQQPAPFPRDRFREEFGVPTREEVRPPTYSELENKEKKQKKGFFSRR